MSARKNIFLTGATGFLGSHLMHRLLQEGHHVAALARSSKNSPASDRVRQVLMDVGDAPVTNLETYEGDISLPGLGLHEDASRLLASRTDEVWHCAASLSFQQEDRDEIFRMNVDGTRNVLEWVKRTKGRRLQHVSTAYIAGKRADVVLEDEVDMGQTFKNAYEESKCRAELLIAAAATKRSHKIVGIPPEHRHRRFANRPRHPLSWCLRFHPCPVDRTGTLAPEDARNLARFICRCVFWDRKTRR